MTHLATSTFPLHLPPAHLLACPHCGATAASGLVLQAQTCTVCELQFFDLGGMISWFVSGRQQREQWSTLLGITLDAAVKNLQFHQRVAEQVDLSASLRERLSNAETGIIQKATVLAELFSEAGLEPKVIAEHVAGNANGLLHYFELLLRDWAWDEIPGFDENENDGAYRRVHQAICASSGGETLGDTLVLGAGAGRLSWDIQRKLNPSTTIALDNNPLLAYVSHHLITHKRSIQLTETQVNPQVGLPGQALWTLAAPEADTTCADNWFAIAADAWHAPLNAGQFDLVVTPWFIDVSSRDIRELIALISRLLKPGGRWLNSGPLLYSTHLPPQSRYTHEEVAGLIELAGFEFEYHNFESVTFLRSPLSTQTRTEQVWTFAAKAPMQITSGPGDAVPPAWLQLPHLPIPNNLQVDTQGEPVLQHLMSLVDGQVSINQIAALMAPNLGPDQDPVAVIKSVFGQILLAEKL